MDIDIIWQTTVRLLQSGLLPPLPEPVVPEPPEPVVRPPIRTPTAAALWPSAGVPTINTEPPGPFPEGGWPPITPSGRHPITGAPIWEPPAGIRPPLGFPGLNAARPPTDPFFPPVEPPEPTEASGAAPGAPASYPGGSGPTSGAAPAAQPAQGRQIPAEPSQQQPGPPIRRPGSQADD